MAPQLGWGFPCQQLCNTECVINASVTTIDRKLVATHLAELRSSAPASHPRNALPRVLFCHRLMQLATALRFLDSHWLRSTQPWNAAASLL